MDWVGFLGWTGLAADFVCLLFSDLAILHRLGGGRAVSLGDGLLVVVQRHALSAYPLKGPRALSRSTCKREISVCGLVSVILVD